MKDAVQELVIISGKGGTGKTSIAASFALLAGRAVLADCDVDAANLHLILAPDVDRHGVFRSGHTAVIRAAECARCGDCERVCRFGAARPVESGQQPPKYAVDPVACEGCGVCVRFCPEQAIDFPERTCGDWFVSETRCGPMVHARLGIAAENSGKLVSLVRAQARQIANTQKLDWLLIDGAPGIGCPVIASLAGANLALAVAEPTLSGVHDLERVLQLTKHFGISTTVCINKWDLNPSMTRRIERTARARGAAVAGRVSYDKAVTAAQLRARTVVECESAAADDIRTLWSNVVSVGGEDGVRP